MHKATASVLTIVLITGLASRVVATTFQPVDSDASVPANCQASTQSEQTSPTNQASSNGLTGTLSNLNGVLGGVLAPVQRLLGQIRCFREPALDSAGQLIAGTNVSEMLQTVEQAMGALNLLDPETLLQGAMDWIGGDRSSANSLPISQENPVLTANTMRVLGNVANARTDANSVLSQSGQEQMSSQLMSLNEQADMGMDEAFSVIDLARRATEIFGIVSELNLEGNGTSTDSAGRLTVPATSVAAASASLQSAQQAQNRVSTQDAIKDLSIIQANVSVQMSQLAHQNALQTRQLGHLSNQNVVGLQMDAAQLARLNQVVTAAAVSNQILADMNERQQGDLQQEHLANVADTNRLNLLNSMGYRLNP